MQSSIVSTLETLSAWRSQLERGTAGFARFLTDHELSDESDAAMLASLRERLSADKLVLAFVAEFSRGKSELINAIFFADAGRRVMPATPGRTTMCPVELFHDPAQPPRLLLLPIETRLRGLPLADLRGREEPWQQIPLVPGDADSLADALAAVTRTQRVSIEDATALGFWSHEHPEDNPPLEADGQVDVPAWRHALINYPHPLLARGLVVLDTPGLNAIGAEPELTLSLLPSAHATVFVLAADSGVTKSDLAIWREHLAGNAAERFVVLNKIDALVDPLATQAEVDSHIERQCEQTAATLGVARDRIFPLSARNALAARVAGDPELLVRSRLPALEQAITAQLLPRQRELMMESAASTVVQLKGLALRRLGDRRRQQAEQLMELRGLRGKSGAKVRLMLQRVDDEMLEFEACTQRLAAVRAVQARMLRGVLGRLASDSLRSEVSVMQSSISGGPFAIGAKQAFSTLFERLRTRLQQATTQADELRQMLDASFLQLNAEFGFAFTLSVPPTLDGFRQELNMLDRSYARYLGITQSWRLAMPGFGEQFRRMLLSKLRVIFENAAGELEMWSKSASNQMDVQLRERRKTFKRRREALERIQSAAGELEQRISEVERQDQRLVELQRHLEHAAEDVLSIARGALAERTETLVDLRLDAA